MTTLEYMRNYLHRLSKQKKVTKKNTKEINFKDPIKIIDIDGKLVEFENFSKMIKYASKVKRHINYRFIAGYVKSGIYDINAWDFLYKTYVTKLNIKNNTLEKGKRIAAELNKKEKQN